MVPRVVRPRRIVDGVGFLRFPAARASRTTRDGAPRGRAGSRAPARLRETKRDASEAPTARDSSRTWRGGVCRARNNGEDVTLSSARGIEFTKANKAKLAEIVRVARLEPAGDPAVVT